jgi:hypothetical protein
MGCQSARLLRVDSHRAKERRSCEQLDEIASSHWGPQFMQGNHLKATHAMSVEAPEADVRLLLDYFVGTPEHCGCNLEPEGVGCVEVDYQTRTESAARSAGRPV